MPKLIAKLSLCLMLLMSLFAFNTMADDQPSAVKDLQDALQDMQTLQAHFVQTIMDSDKQVLQRSEGQMALQRPGFFRWDIQKPNQQLVLINQQHVWIYDKDLAQVTVQRLSQAMGATPALLLSATDQALTKRFSVVRIEGATPGQWFRLHPRMQQEQFTEIILHFIPHGIKEMQLKDNLSEITTITFDKLQINQAINPSLFTFIPPKGVDIIHNDV